MTARETGLLSSGLILGIVAASITFVLWNRSPEATPASQNPDPHAGHAAAPADEQNKDAAVQLTAYEQRQIAVETADVRRQLVTEQITTTGRVEEAETAIRTISARVGGRIDRLFVNFTGQAVRTGQPVAEIYSPEIVTAAEEYKLALENRKHLAASQQPAAITQADALVEASQRRLELWGLSSDQINALLATPQTPIHITITSSATGIIRTRNISEGQYVNAGDALLDVIDLNTVWIEADVFQPDIGRIRPGLRARITSDALPGITLRAVVNFIKPQSDPASRTTPVRMQVDNPGMRLRPGMFVNAAFDLTPGANVLTVPRSAVIDTGTEKIVYLALPDGVFQRRAIQTGAPAGDYYPVLSGLSEGDRVVTNGAFLIDSQTRLTGGMTGIFGGSTSFGEAAGDLASAYKITFRMEPDPPAGARENTVHATVVDSAGKPVSDAQVRMTIIMPAMPSMGMPEMRNSAVLQWNGSEYVGTITIGMAGGWNVVVEARRGSEVLATYRTRFDAR
jgi:Cu(I)/Ag(I) efflux system membrane fusion protein/cobalt-zinc-cadmium efflux system membrane fusion protein